MSCCCFMKGCELEVQYICLCSSFETFCCEFHLESHLKLPYRTHVFDSVFVEPSEGAKDAILRFLSKEKSKKQKLKKITLDSLFHNRYSSKNSIVELESDWEEINSLIEKIYTSEDGKDLQFLNQENLQPSAEATTVMLPKDTFWRMEWIRNKRMEILNRAYNSSKEEQDFRNTCLLYKNSASDSSLSQAYQEYVNNCQQFTSSYLIEYEPKKTPNLYIYDTFFKRETKTVLKIPMAWFHPKFIVQLPNGELFLIGIKKGKCIAFIIEKNYQVQILPSKIPGNCISAIYYNRSVYCYAINDYSNLFIRFDLDGNRWYSLASIEKYKSDNYSNLIIFKRNILISSGKNCKLLLYSIDIDSFSEISYEFSINKSKVLINAEDRLYLFECNNAWWIYESEVLNEYNWKAIAKSTILDFHERQVYCLYDKEKTYISVLNNNNSREYFEFDLGRKALIEIACYSKHFAMKRINDKLATIKCNSKYYKLDPYHDKTTYKRNGYSLYYIILNLEWIAQYNKKIELNCPNIKVYFKKIASLQSLGRNLEAIECYDELLKIYPDCEDAYQKKANFLHSLGWNLEAIECYDEFIKLNPNCKDAYRSKAGFLRHSLHRGVEAIECLNELIKLYPIDLDAHLSKANIFYDLGKKIEALECYNEVLKLNDKQEFAYYRKGEALHDLERFSEAIECYNQVIKLNPNLFNVYLEI